MMLRLKQINAYLVAALTLFGTATIQADDTDIYINNTAASSPPLVMFSIDYKTNLGNSTCTTGQCQFLIDEGYLAATPANGTSYTTFEVLRAVLKKVLAPLGNMKIGLMMNHANNNNCAGPNDSGCSGGSFILQRMLPITNTAGDANKASFHAKLNAIPTPGGTINHVNQGKEMFFEFFRYMTGQDVYSGHLGYKDFGDNTVTTNLDDFMPGAQRDMLAETDTDSTYDTPGRYISPFDTATDHCARIFSVNFMFHVVNQQDEADTDMIASKANQGMENLVLGGPGGGPHTATNNEFATALHWLQQADLADGSWGDAPNLNGKQNVTSFFIDASASSTADEYANAGGTTAAYDWSDDPAALVAQLESVFAQILSVSTTFTAASVPVSVLNRAEIIDNLYIALFRADEFNRQRWPGNLKRLRLDLNDPNALVKDVDGNNAIAADGRIKYESLTYWTDAASLPAPAADTFQVAGKDGRTVARGGAGQKLPGFIGGHPGTSNGSGNRILYYEEGADLKPLNATVSIAGDAYVQANLGIVGDTNATKVLLEYARGLDVTDDDGDAQTNEARAWILGDPLHSRPLPINYGARGSHTDANPDIRIVMGSNDGFMHMFKNTDASSNNIGTEVWAYMPRLTMPIVNTLKSNISGGHPYGVDGPAQAYVKDTSTPLDGIPDNVWLYFGLRRGGKGIYSLDITDPDVPTKKWTIEKTVGGQFDELGLTFSEPRVSSTNMRLDVDGSGNIRPVTIFAGGYDVNKDASGTGTDDTEGQALYIVDAETGALIWKAVFNAALLGYDSASKTYYHPLLYNSIPSTVTVLDTAYNDDMIDRIYFGDSGGLIWRVDMDQGGPSVWTINTFAAVGRHIYSTGPSRATNDRRFFHKVDFIPYKDTIGAYDAVVVGSGDRAHPLKNSVENFLYMLKDRRTTPITKAQAYASGGNFYCIDPTVACGTHYMLRHSYHLHDATGNCSQTNSCTSAENNKLSYYGWQMQLTELGEKVLATPTTLGGDIYFTTYIPPDNSNNSTDCTPDEGRGRLYTVSLANATAVTDYNVLNGTITDATDRYYDLKSGGIPAEVVYLTKDRLMAPDFSTPKIRLGQRWKTFWYPNEY